MATVDNSISDNFAPNWLPFFSPEGDILPDISFNVECGICRNQLAISEPPDGENTEGFTVLPCGHAFGHECVSNWLQSTGSPNCPSCRYELWHGECEHAIIPQLIQLEDGKNMRQAISDCIGEEIPPNCDECQSGGGGRRRSSRGGDNDNEGEFDEGYSGDGSSEPPEQFQPHYDPLPEFANLNFGYGPRYPHAQIPIAPDEVPYGGHLYGPLRRAATFSGMSSAPGFSGTPHPRSHRRRRRHRHDADENLDMDAIREMVTEEFDEWPESRNLPPNEREAAINHLVNRVAGRIGRW
ncbi:hypothetical protein GGR58DRAFT_510768 [Xylaria digitata]|nr:hypothetical protein GGR58DRAFT_510768 [Xylaria digitata]